MGACRLRAGIAVLGNHNKGVRMLFIIHKTYKPGGIVGIHIIDLRRAGFCAKIQTFIQALAVLRFLHCCASAISSARQYPN